MLDKRLAMIENIAPLFGMLNDDDPRSARDQLDAHYRHGGGWNPFKGHTLNRDNTLSYPGDQSMRPVAMTMLHDTELVIVYECAWVAIIQEDRTFEVCRMD
jgi:hypothetical protein